MNQQPFPWASLPRVDSVDARLVSRLSLAGRASTFSEALSRAFEVTCRYEHARATYHPTGFSLTNDDGFVARVTTVPTRLPMYVWVPSTSCGPLLHRLFDDTTPRGPTLSETEWGAMAYVALTMLKASIDAGLPPMHLEANRPPNVLIARDLAHTPVIESVIVFRGDGMGRNFARLLVPGTTATELANHLRPAMHWDDALGRAVVFLPVMRSVGELDTLDVGGLAPGDIVFVAESIDELLASVFVRTSHHTMTSKLVHEGQRFDLHVRKIEELELNHASPDAATTQLTTSTVELEVKIGALKVSLAELAAIAPGAVFALDVHPGDPVEIMIAGQPIASAELVLVGERVGCRVIQRLR